MTRSARIILSCITAAILIFAATGSYFWPATARWTHWELSKSQSVFAGVLIARTSEVGLISGRLRWMRTDWLATPEMPDDPLDTVPPKNGISLQLNDQNAIRVSDRNLSWHWAGLGYGQATIFHPGPSAIWGFSGLWQANVTEFCVPVWMLVILAGLPLLRYARRKRPAGHCRRCGYDLRATPERCPECGLVVERKLTVEK